MYCSVWCLTRDFGFEGAAHDMLRSSIFNGDEVATGSHGCVGDLVSFWTLLTIHLHLRWAVDGDRQSSWASVTRVYNEIWRYTCDGWDEASEFLCVCVLTLLDGCLLVLYCTCSSPLQSRPKSRYHSWISCLAGFSYTDLEGTARDVTPVKTDIDGVDAVLPWNKPYGVFICTKTGTQCWISSNAPSI